MALSGSNKTVILDDPFTGLTHDQTLKLVKIIRQKIDCTLIVTAKSKAQIEMLHAHQVLTIQNKPAQYQAAPPSGFLLAVRVKVTEQIPAEGEDEAVNQLQSPRDDVVNPDELGQFISENYSIFEKLRGKKRSLVNTSIQRLMKVAGQPQSVCDEITEMVLEGQDLDLRTPADEFVLKCQLTRSLFLILEALVEEFGEVHLEHRHEDYAVLRVVKTAQAKEERSTGQND